ncbi:MAG: molybdopterin-dependent oxidoreductase [Gammaproteobacteria bacterium]|nr:molybdopterin-dependent oxidoreductase [Gammaproteobacteria bacterium]
MSKISRRDLLQYIGAGGVGTGAGYLFAEAIKRPVEFLIPPVVPPEDYSPGVATWYNTVCNQCSAGCGISVRTREGRAKKIEGNPAHPVNQGRLCARGQAGLNALYNPDRIRAPLKRVGERGDGAFETISWDEALTQVAGRLGRLKIEDRADRVQLLTGGIRGHLGELFEQFITLLGSDRYAQYDFTYPANLRLANRLSFGIEHLPYYDIANCDFLLSFGADYLGTWLSPVHFSLGYGQLRQGREQRGRCIQIEPRMSLSGANADEWIAAVPGSEGVLALGIARILVADGTYTGSDRDAWQRALEPYSGDRVAAATGVALERVQQLAAEFGSSKASLAIGGGAAAAGTNAVASLVAVNALNHLAGNLGQPGGIIFNSAPVFGSATRHAGLTQMTELAASMQDGAIEVLLLHDTNPIYAMPDAAGFADAMAAVPTIVAMSSFMDETTAMADLILPTDTYLEAWGDDAPEPGVGLPVASISQPVVARVYDTRSVGDIVLSLARRIGFELPVALPWANTKEFIKDAWKKLYTELDPQADAADFEEFWLAALQAGVWGRVEATGGPGDAPAPSTIPDIDAAAATFAGDTAEFPFILHPYLSATLFDGRGANLPWLQELPDQMTSVVYGSWIELNPATAGELGIRDGDLIEVESPAGSIRAPAYLFPAIEPGVVAMPFGQGHTAYGRYAQNRGVNPVQLVALQSDQQSGELAWAGTRVKLRNTGERARVVRNDGISRTLGRQILHPEENHA